LAASRGGIKPEDILEALKRTRWAIDEN